MNGTELSNWKSDLIVGAWRNGLGQTPAQDLPNIEKRRQDGFRLSPLENLVITLADLLDSYDELFAEQLAYEPLDEGVPV